jgi:molybdate transport system substrate-binding protein
MIRRLMLRLAVCAAALAAAGSAAAAEIRMIASNAVKEPYLELLPRFEKASGHSIRVDWGGTVDILKRLRAGETADIVIATKEAIDELTKEGRLAPDSRVDLVKSTIGVAQRPGIPRADISSSDAIKRSLLAAKSVVFSGGPSNVYVLGLLDRMGIAAAVKAKGRQLAPGQSVGEALARGEGDIGFTQVSELIAVKGIAYLGPLPAEIQQVTIFSAGLGKTTRETAAAKALLAFVTGSQAQPVLAKTGLAPG